MIIPLLSTLVAANLAGFFPQDNTNNVKFEFGDVKAYGNVLPNKGALIQAPNKESSVFVKNWVLVDVQSNIVADVGIDGQFYVFTNAYVATPDGCLHKILTVDDIKPECLK